MLQAQQVWARVKKLKAFAQYNEFDFRPVYYVQSFNPAAAVAGVEVPTAFNAQDFANGAILLGITASAHPPGVAQSAGNNRQLFGLDFQFSNTDSIVVNGPVIAAALLGGGDQNLFPSREIIIPVSSKINCRAVNYTTAALNIQVVYHALVYRSNT